MTPERIDLRAVPPQPWKNGAGTTRELARRDDGEGGFDWRVSVAEVAADAPFSPFPGIDRCIVLLDGHGLRLRTPRAVHRLARAFEPFGFSGDDAVDAELVDGPTTDFNVMVRRGRWLAEVGEPPPVGEPADAGLLLCWHGALQAGDGHALAARQALLWSDGLPALTVRPTQPDTRALLVRLRRA